MKVSGFTFVRNAVKYDYPVVEAILSILPLVDEFIVSVADSEDDTLALIQSIESSKIIIVHSSWDLSLREGGKILAVETDKAMDHVSKEADWLFYVQADEVVHEKYLPVIREAMEKYRDDLAVEGLLFRYVHFYGSYKYVGDGRTWYAREVRIIRNNIDVRSYRDAQGFRIGNRKLKVKEIDACMYHYGYVKNPLFMKTKSVEIGRYWRDDEEQQKLEEQYDRKGIEFDYSDIDTLDMFRETHPAVMENRIRKEDWNFTHDIKKKTFKNWKHKALYYLQDAFGWRLFEYRNYKKI